MGAADRAVEQFATASGCSQSVATAFTGYTGMDFETIHQLTTGFGEGMGTRQFTCGAVTGGIFVLSSVFGSRSADDAEAKAHTRALVDRFIDTVEKRLGTLACRELLGMSLEEAARKNLFSEACPTFVRICAEEAENILKEEGK